MYDEQALLMRIESLEHIVETQGKAIEEIADILNRMTGIVDSRDELLNKAATAISEHSAHIALLYKHLNISPNYEAVKTFVEEGTK